MNPSAKLLPASPRLLPLTCGAGHPRLRRLKHLPNRGCDVVTIGNPSTGQPDTMREDEFVLSNQAADQRVRYRKRMAAQVWENIAQRYKQACLGIAWTKTGRLDPFAHSPLGRQPQA